MRGSTTHRFALLAVLLLFGVDTSAAQLLDSTSSDPLHDDGLDVPGAPDLDGTGSILDWAGNLTALPGMTSQGPPVQSHVLGLALPPSLLPARYVADATAQERPLRHALLTWNDALGLQDEAALLADPELERADDLPLDVQVAVAALLYALTDSTLIQAEALEGLDADERSLLLSLPDALMTAGDDPQAWVDDPQLSALSEVGSKVDMAPIQDAARIVASTVTHVMPTLESWSRMEQEAAERNQPRQDDLAEYTDAYSPQRIESMHRIERLDALSEALRMAGDWNGQQVLDLSPIEPASGTTLSDSLRGLAATGSMVLPTPISVDASTLDQADRLPSGLQKAIARIAINQEAWLQSTLDQDPTDPASLARSTTAAVRLVNAVEVSAPTIEAFGLLYSHHAYPGIPKLPSDLQQAVPRHVLATDAVARHGTATPALQHAFGSQGATAREVGAPPLPPRGSLETAVLDLYQRYDLDVDAETRQRLHDDVMALAPTVERNAARMLMVQLDATDMLTGLYQSLTVEELQLISSMAPAHVQNRILEGEVSLHDLQRLEAYYDVVDRVRDGYHQASLTVAAATDASREALADYGTDDMAMDIAPEWGKPILATLNAMLPGVQAQSEGEENDVLFADPLLGTVVIGGFGRTEYTTTMGVAEMQTRYGSTCCSNEPNEVNSRLDVTPRGQVLSLDLGGDDLYRSNAGGAFLSFIPSTPQADQSGAGAAGIWAVLVEAWVDPSSVSIALDMAGDDRYEPPADPESMQNEIGQDVDANQGSFAREAGAQWSTSDAFVMDPRAIQGAGVGGVGLLWDLGGDDQYTAATAAQGFGGGVYDPERPDGVRCTPPAPPLCSTGLYGVGMLLDGSGDDRYQAEGLSQGASAPLQSPRVAGQDFVGRTPVGGVGLLVDGDGDDHYLLPQGSRGQGFSDAGVGMLLDGLGDDAYRGGSQARGQNGGIGVLVDLDGGDDYTQRNDHTNARYRDGTCRARIDPGDPVAGVAPGFGVFADAEGDCSINAFHTLGDAPGADPFALPDQVVAAGEEAQEDVEEQVGGLEVPGPDDVLDPPEGFVMAPVCVDGIGVFALGDATDTTYADGCDFLLTIDLGGNDTYRNNAGGPLAGLVSTLVVDAGDAGDHYDQSGKTCVQGCNAFLIDMGGGDRYEAQNLAQGVTTVLGGLSGALFDAAGDDSYEVSPSGTAQGSVIGDAAGSTAVFLDLAGDDHYTSGTQGFLNCKVVGAAAFLVAGGTGCSSTAAFLELGGNDTYQPVGRQGEANIALSAQASPTGAKAPSGRGGGWAVFVDNHGWDTYRGQPAHTGGPDVSDHRNDRMSIQGETRSRTGSWSLLTWSVGVVPASYGIFWDRDAAGSNGGPGRALDIPSLGVGIGVGGPDLWEHDYAMLVDPAGDDVYRNNAAGTLLHAGAAADVPSNPLSLSAGSSTTSSGALAIASVLLDLGGSDHYDGSHTRTLAEWDLDAHEQPVPVDEGTELPAPSTTDAIDRPSRTGALVQGAGFLGVGMLADIGTDDDLFEARGLVQGFGLFGTGILWSQGGDDEFRVPSDVVRNPAVGGDLMAWEEFMPRPLADAQTGDSTAAMMTWRPVAAHPHVSGCSFQLLPEGTVGPVRDMDIHLASPQDGMHAAVMSRFTETSGFPHWEARQVDITGTGLDDGGCPAVTTVDKGPLAEDAASNQLHPVAGFSGGPANLVFPHGPFYVWQDDRNAEWDLYWNTGATSSGGDRDHLVIPGSDQTRPAVSERYVAYQDDRNAPASPSSIYMVAFSSLNETLVSADAAGDPLPGEHTDPSISNVLVAWQARASEDDPWQVMVHNRLENETRTLAVGGTQGLPPADPAGDHVLASPRVSGSRTVVFTLTSPDGVPSAYRYDWSSDEASLVSDSVTAVTVNPSNAGTMAWVDTDAASATERGTRTWEAVWDQSGQPSRQVSVTNSLTHGLLMQGAAWQAGTGLLLSQAGLDAYEARSWAQGAAFSRGQPDTSYPRAECTREVEGICEASAPGTRGPPVQHAHAVLLDLDGNDHYRVRSNGQGAHVGGEFAAWSSTSPGCVPGMPPTCNPVNFGQVVEVTENAGILLDLRGSDRYEAASRSQGISNLVAAVVLTDEEEKRNLISQRSPDGIATTNVHPLISVGVLMDMGGRDGYTYDQENRLDKVPLDTTAAQCSTFTDAVEALWTGPPEDNWTAARDALFADNDNPLQPAVDLWNDTVRARWEALNESVQSGGPIMPTWNETRDELRNGEFSQMVEWWGNVSTAETGSWRSGGYQDQYGPWQQSYAIERPEGYPYHQRYPQGYQNLKQPAADHPAPQYGAVGATMPYAYSIETGEFRRAQDGWGLGNVVWVQGWAYNQPQLMAQLQTSSGVWMTTGMAIIHDMDNLIQGQSDNLTIDEPEDWDQVVQQWQDLDALVFDLLANTDLSVPEQVPEDQRDAINEAQGDTRDALQDGTSVDPPGTVSQACQTVVDAVDSLNLDAEGLTKVDADGSSRNNHVWTQRIRSPTTINPGVEPFAVSVGGVGADLPMMDQLSNQLRGFIEDSLGVDLKVVKVSQEEELDRASGAVVLRTEIEDLDGLADLFQVNLVEVHIDGAFHGYADRNESASEGSPDMEVWDLQWDTDIPDWPDSDYSVQSIVRYGVADHRELGSLGSVDNTRNVTVDNPPRIHDVGVSTPAFSPVPAPFAQATSAHPTVHFTTSLDPGIDGGDAWATIQVFDATGKTLIDTLATDTLVVGDDGGARAQWDGRYGDNNSIVPPGDYRIRVTATDNLSDDDRIRVAPHVPVRVASDSPRDGCVRFLSSERTCHDPSISVGEAAAQGTGDTRIVPLVLTAPAGVEVKRVYVFESIPSSGGTWGDWQLTDTHNVGTSLTEVDHALPLNHSTTKRVLVLFEDPFGNVECVPWCGATHNDLDDVPSSGDLFDAAERKAAGGDYSEFFADYGRPETELVSDANAQAILYRINGEDLGPDVTPRIGPNDTIEMFLLGSDSTSDLSKTKLLWRHGNDKPTDPDLEAPGFVRECIESPCPPGDVLFRWDAWESLLAEREWPEGDLLWKFDVRDQAGNAPVSGIAGAVLFDKTAPHLADSEDAPVVVEYGGGGTSVQSEDETVSITVRVIDPTIGLAFSDWKKFTVLLNASAITQSADDTSLLPMKPHASSPDRFDVTFPVDHPDLNDSVLAESGWLERLPLHLADEAGNWNNQSAVEVALGQPQLGLQRVEEAVGVHNATIRWTTDVDANVTLHLTNATGHTFPPIHSPFGTVHDFIDIPIDPASLYTYQIEAVDQDGLRDVAGPFTLHSLAGLDGAIDAPADGAILSGVASLHGSFEVESDPLPEARVQVRAFNDSLLGGSRLVMDEVVRSSGQTQDTLRTFSNDLVTSALPDGEYRLEVLLTYQSPVMEEVKLLQVTDLLVDNSAPVLEPLAPETGDVLDTSPDAITFHATDDWTDILPATTTLRINGHLVEDIVASATATDDPQDATVRIQLPPDAVPTGPLRFTITVQDAAGNLGVTSYTLSYDPDAPRAVGTDDPVQVRYPEGQTAAKPGDLVQVHARLGDATGIDSVLVDASPLGGDDAVSLQPDATGHVTTLRVGDDVPAGETILELLAEDDLGHQATFPVTVQVERSPPALAGSDPVPTSMHSARLGIALDKEARSVWVDLYDGEQLLTRVPALPDDLAAFPALAGAVGVHGYAADLDGLGPGDRYQVAVEVIGPAGHNASHQRDWRFAPVVVDAPDLESLSAQIMRNGRVQLEWSTLQDIPDDAVKYIVYRASSDAGFEPVVSTWATHHQDQPTTGATHRYFVQAENLDGMLGSATPITDVFVPKPAAVTAWEVTPSRGVEGTPFRFTATVQGTGSAAPVAWVVLEGDPYRMALQSGDCRDECTFATTIHAPVAFRTLEQRFHVEVTDGDMQLRGPREGEAPGPRVLLGPDGMDGDGAGSSHGAPSVAPMTLIALLVAAAVLMRRRSRP